MDPGALLSILREIAARGKKAVVSRFSKCSDPRTRLESELSALGERGCETLLVLGASDSAREIFAEHMGVANMASLPKGLEIEIIQGADHVFATRERARGVQASLGEGYRSGTNTSHPRREKSRCSHRMEGGIAPRHAQARERFGTRLETHVKPSRRTAPPRPIACESSLGRGRRESPYNDLPADAFFISLSRWRFWFSLSDCFPGAGFSRHLRQIFLVKATSHQLQFVVAVGSARPVSAARSS